jgi:arylsulfatase A-like enzyme
MLTEHWLGTVLADLPPFGLDKESSMIKQIPCWLRSALTVNAILTWGSALNAAETDKPNVIIFLADDLGYGDIGAHGSHDIPTPNIDSLAKSGIRCTSGYSSHSYCSPMRAGLMTGRYQHRFGYERNMPYDSHNRYMGLPAGETTIATRVKKAGYKTGMVGKWHLGAAHVFHPNKRGFDFFFGFLGGGHDYFVVDLHRPTGEGYFDALQRNGQPEGLDGYLTTVLAREASQFVDANHEAPFFLYVAFNAPHTPMQAPDEYLEKFQSIANKKRRTYAAMVSAMDDGIGMIMKTVEQHQLRNKTLVFFLSDNGGPENANASDNGPLRGQKGQVFEGGIRVPFIVSWPGVLEENSTYDSPVISLDISRTLLAVAGAEPQDSSKLDGVNLLPYLQGKETRPPHDVLFWRQNRGDIWALRSANNKLLVDRREEGQPQLYDLSQDIGETANLAGPSSAQLVKALRDKFLKWDSQNSPPFFLDYRSYWEHMDEVYKSAID